MIYLLDVGPLLALGLQQHVFYMRVATWVQTFENQQDTMLAACAITRNSVSCVF